LKALGAFLFIAVATQLPSQAYALVAQNAAFVTTWRFRVVPQATNQFPIGNPMSHIDLNTFARAMLLALPTLCLLCSHAQAADVAVGTLPSVTVRGVAIEAGEAGTANSLKRAALASKIPATSDTASMLSDVPGLSLNGAGAVSSLPSIHGLADDRLRIQVDGMDLIASCPNHMNPALSYIDPSNVGQLKVYSGITPVSAGGDSIGGTIIVDSRKPEFAAPGQAAIAKGELGAFYRSNNKASGGNISATYANEKFNINYSGSTSKADNYTAAGDFKTTTDTGRTAHTLPLNEVGSSAYDTSNQSLALALKSENHLFEVKLGTQDMPKQLYPNQRMDLLKNNQQSVNLRYTGTYDWGNLQTRVYQEDVDHYMDFGADKQFQYGTAPGMPMYTKGKTTGGSLKAEVELNPQALLRAGLEVQQYQLNDWWPPSGTGGMSPYTFWNINNGKRDRTALFGEWEKNINPQWLSIVGLRFEQVNTNADSVHGYNLATAPTLATPVGMMNQTRDAANFNNADRNKKDSNLDFSALARYTATANYDIDFGFAHKVRSPNLYERYTWSTASMMGVMNNFVGDGNGYVGDINLKPEQANTLSATFSWHTEDNAWDFKAAPFYTQVTDYIDAVPTAALVANQFNVLKFANQSARLYGIDLSGHMPLVTNAWGAFGLKGLLNYTNGTNRDTGAALYNVMPLNAKLAVTQQSGSWDNSLELVMVQEKSNVSDVRNEVKTPGYSLVNARGSYTLKQVRVDFGVENLFDKFYYLPTGGTYTGQGTTMSINGIPAGIAVPGMGRSIYVGVNVKF
jgi:iron complex outermembrane receptor protein